MNILVLSNIYPAPDLEKENTPVVHYFTREWIKMECKVRVVHYPANFPKLLMWGASPFKRHFSSMLGTTIRTTQAVEKEYVLDEVKVKRIPLLKYKLHGAFPEKEISRAYNKTVEWLEAENFIPDVITSHWVNPQLEIMARLKEHFHSGTCYVAHTPTEELISIYNEEKIHQLLSVIDSVGFRSAYIHDKFISTFGYNGPTFQCYSGIPEQYIPNEKKERNFVNVNRFVFVGTLIKRKFPAEIIPAVFKALGDVPFSINYIGKGAEEKNIRKNAMKYGVVDKVHLLGRMGRDEVVYNLQDSDVFVMNSKSEAFGLVYLEAMAQGCITIASRHEGFDGIIQDGVNGFLCNAGDIEDLATTIARIKHLSNEQLLEISNNAISTARKLTDQKAALMYLHELEKMIR